MPPADHEPVTIAGLGPNIKASVTVRFGGGGARQPPGGLDNGVVAKVNGQELVVLNGTLAVWGHNGTTTAAGRLGGGGQVQVEDGDRVRLRVRAPEVGRCRLTL